MKYNHYHKQCQFNSIDIYRILLMYEVTDPCLAHAIKKLLVAGKRGAKSEYADIQEAIDTLSRWQDMRIEEIQRDK